MKISTVTVTGADDQTSIPDMVALSQDYPVEWGILLAPKGGGYPRFPTESWIRRLRGRPLYMSGHLCGGYVRDLVNQGTFSFADSGLVQLFARYQINFHAQIHLDNNTLLCSALSPWISWDYQFIFQMDGVNDWRIQDNPNAFPLFDRSHGGGVSPTSWPAPTRGYCGYAGGFSPENLGMQLAILESVVGDHTIWIDAETHLRNAQNQFDLSRVKTFLEGAKPYFL